MLKFLFGGKKSTPVVEIETDRARFARLMDEVNVMIDTLPVKPRVTLDPATGHITLETPEQFADEALALPAPTVEDTPKEDAAPEANDKAPEAAPEKSS